MVGIALLSLAEAMAGGVWGVILCPLYRNLSVGLHIKSLIFETSIFLLSTKKKGETNEGTTVCRCIFTYDNLVPDPQTHIPLESCDCQLSAYLIILGGQYE